MPSTITLKNVPDEVHARLREAAQAHHRSVNSEAIVCLEQVLMPKRKESVEEELASIREMRAGLKVWIGSNDELNELKNEGRR